MYYIKDNKAYVKQDKNFINIGIYVSDVSVKGVKSSSIDIRKGTEVLTKREGMQIVTLNEIICKFNIDSDNPLIEVQPPKETPEEPKPKNKKSSNSKKK